MINFSWKYNKVNDMFMVTITENNESKRVLVGNIYRDAVSQFRSFEKRDGEAHADSYEQKSTQAIILQGVTYWNTEFGYDKPPLGIKPAWLAAQCRIQELSEAIIRQIEDIKPNTDLIRKWAYEIISQSDLYEEDKDEGK